jgi:hypothetical protein
MNQNAKNIKTLSKDTQAELLKVLLLTKQNLENQTRVNQMSKIKFYQVSDCSDVLAKCNTQAEAYRFAERRSKQLRACGMNGLSQSIKVEVVTADNYETRSLNTEDVNIKNKTKDQDLHMNTKITDHTPHKSSWIQIRCSRDEKANIVRTLKTGESLSEFMLDAASEKITLRGIRDAAAIDERLRNM